jgi:hypothetical protein
VPQAALIVDGNDVHVVADRRGGGVDELANVAGLALDVAEGLPVGIGEPDRVPRHRRRALQ